MEFGVFKCCFVSSSGFGGCRVFLESASELLGFRHRSSRRNRCRRQGAAFRLDLQKLAGEVDPRDAYARALYDYLQSNPAAWEDPAFFVNFVIYLISKEPGIDCNAAFANKFERRDYFTSVPAMKETLRQIVNSTRLPNRFDVGYVIETGEYELQRNNLPFSRISSVGLNGAFTQP